MEINNEYIINKEGDDKYKMTVKGKPEIFGIIEKEYNENRSKSVYSIKYFWKKVFQDKKYADDLDEAKDKLQNILTQVDSQIKHIQTFENFNPKK